jgi:hypothetical protein
MQASIFAIAAFAPWPLSNVLKYATAPVLPKDAKPAATRFSVAGPVMTSPVEHAMLLLTCAWKFIFALAVYYSFLPNDLLDKARLLDPAWIVGIVVRDLLITYAVGTWDLVNLAPSSPAYAMMKVTCFLFTDWHLQPDSVKTRRPFCL